MRDKQRFVIDTGIFVSAAFWGGLPEKAIEKATLDGVLIFSESTSLELISVFNYEKFDALASREVRAAFLLKFADVSEMVIVQAPIKECEDPNDDKILEAAFYGKADLVIASDKKIKKLHPFRQIPVLSPAQFLAWDLP